MQDRKQPLQLSPLKPSTKQHVGSLSFFNSKNIFFVTVFSFLLYMTLKNMFSVQQTRLKTEQPCHLWACLVSAKYENILFSYVCTLYIHYRVQECSDYCHVVILFCLHYTVKELVFKHVAGSLLKILFITAILYNQFCGLIIGLVS